MHRRRVRRGSPGLPIARYGSRWTLLPVRSLKVFILTRRPVARLMELRTKLHNPFSYTYQQMYELPPYGLDRHFI